MDEVLLQAVRESGAHIGVVYLLQDNEPLLVMDVEVGMPAQLVKPWARVRLNAGTPVAAAARQRRLVWVPDHEELARRFPATALAAPYPFAIAAAPIMTGRALRGVFLLLWPESHSCELATREKQALAAACDRVAAILQRPVEHPLSRAGEPRVLTPAPPPAPEQHPESAVCGYLDRIHVGCLVLDLEGRITFVSAAAAELFDGDVTGLLGRPLWEVAPWLKDPLFEDRCRAAVIGQQMTSCATRCPDGRVVEFRIYPDPSGISLRVAPLDVDNPAHMNEPESGREALTRAEVFYSFLPLAVALTRVLNIPEIIDLVADHVMPMFKVKAMAILVAEGGRMRVMGARGYGQDVLERLDGLPITSDMPAGDVARTGAPAFFADVHELRQRYPHAEGQDEMSAWAFLPLEVHDEGVGSCLFAFDEPHPFTVEERTTFTALAGMLAHALDRALRYDSKDRLAHSLQKALLPRSLPEIAGLDVAAWYVPATRGVGIGGDFYDLIRLTDTSAAAVIGDVQGHNVTAAALMGQVRTAIHANAVAGASPGNVLKHTNRLLIDVDTELFTSCLLIYVDLQLRTLRAASAGHPPPLLRPPNMPAEIIDVPVGLVLGVDPDADYPTLQVPFPPGALLALYTDGLVETPGIDLDHAIGNLAGHLTHEPQELQQLGRTLLEHAPHTSQRADDIALLLLEHRAKPMG
ncbi:SpoIIE family protein phosphatase [Nonomuraea sp. B19D2]|uniref:SpoIIE family protein phosphatase n=1 Tax=Nonomuraea sp. B19D2 TaxID=3159561 RepID=UPI0032DB0435